jgi:hypothetical protein
MWEEGIEASAGEVLAMGVVQKIRRGWKRSGGVINMEVDM